MNVIWCVDSIGLWRDQHWIICRRKRRGKREFGQKEKTMKRIRCCAIGVFGYSQTHSCVKHEKHVCVWIRRVWLWKSERQGEKNGWKRGGKKRGKGKVVLGKVLFVFCWLCVCLFPFFPCTHHITTPQHTLTLTHHPPHNMTHWCTPSHANMAVCWRCWEHSSLPTELWWRHFLFCN